MKKRTLGRSGIEIAPLVFGGNVFGWTVDQARSFELLDRFVALVASKGNAAGILHIVVIPQFQQHRRRP